MRKETEHPPAYSGPHPRGTIYRAMQWVFAGYAAAHKYTTEPRIQVWRVTEKNYLKPIPCLPQEFSRPKGRRCLPTLRGEAARGSKVIRSDG